MTTPADELYFEWLRDQSTPSDTISTYDAVLRRLYNTRYVPLETLDDNRAEDGKELREEWHDLYNDYASEIDDTWFEEDCSILEMFVALSRRCEFQTTHTSAQHWVSIFLMNLDILISDFEFEINQDYIDSTIDDFTNGVQTIFPTNVPNGSSKQLWYQMMDYIEEQGLNE